MEKRKAEFEKVGINFSIGKDAIIHNPQYMSFGDNFYAWDRFKIEAYDNYYNQQFNPKITIGNNVHFNTDVHIGCINKIVIGDNCLFASRIYITDHHHGDTSLSVDMQTSPIKRPLVSSGPVVIGNNVLVGEGVAIMPGVTIGDNCIIGTNAVVTKDLPPNAVAAGIPAKILKFRA